MDKNNFILDKIDRKDNHEDYWYKVSGQVKEVLTNKYMEMCMIEVTRVVYSKDEDVVGVQRLFPFNYDVVMSDDIELKNILKELSK